MWLASVNEIRDDLGFDDMTDINEAIGAALHAAEPILAARLGSEFGELSVTDTFYVDEPGYVRGRSVQTEFRLTRGSVPPLRSVLRSASSCPPTMANPPGRHSADWPSMAHRRPCRSFGPQFM